MLQFSTFVAVNVQQIFDTYTTENKHFYEVAKQRFTVNKDQQL